MRLTNFLPVLLVWVTFASPVSAERDWIAAGTYLDWPDSLTQPVDSLDLLQGPGVEPAGWAESDVIYSEPGEFQLGVPSSPRAGAYGWELLPEGLLYKSYLAGEKEPRFAAQWLWEKDRGLVWETALGGRWGMFRKGTPGPDGEGFQFDVEGAALARVDPEEESDLEAADFRAGFIGTWRRGPWRQKAGYYHISSHIGDEYLLKNWGFPRRNYVRDALLYGLMYDVTPEFQIYGEVAVALNHNGGAEPLELQFGAQYAPVMATGLRGAPFAAINGHLRQEFDMGGSVNVQAGWAWVGRSSKHLFRTGFQHYNGPSMQYSFFDRHESLTGLGIWFDF